MLLWFALAVPPSATQTATAADVAKPDLAKPLTISIDLSADRGRDRFGIIAVQRGNWLAQNINWSSPDGQYALSLFLVGYQFKISRWADAVVLAGPWYSYEQHAWNEMVLASHFTLHGERLRVSCTNYWGWPVRSSGRFYDLHTQTITGFPSLPRWLGASFLEKHTSKGLERLFLGPVLTGKKGALSVSASPYWDVQRRTVDIRMGMSYRHVVGKMKGK